LRDGHLGCTAEASLAQFSAEIGRSSFYLVLFKTATWPQVGDQFGVQLF
jgi:hypothetical protein